MSVSTSTNKIVVTAKDQTAQAFKSIQARAISAGSRIASVMGGALAAAGAYLSVRSIKQGIDELSHLSDVAMKANVASGELLRLSSALGILGIQGNSVDQLGQAFSLMEKNTGRSGMAGFYETIGEIGKIPDAGERAKAAMAAFGRSGLNFMPLVNAAKNGTQALQNVVATFPLMSDAHANAADDIADGMAILTAEFQKLWYEAVGSVSQLLSGGFTVSFRQSMQILVAWIEYFGKSADLIFQRFILTLKNVQVAFTSVYSAWGSLVGGTAEKLFGSGGTWGNVWKGATESFAGEWNNLESEMEDVEAEMAKRAEKFAAQVNKAIELENNYRNAAISTSDRKQEEASAARAARLTNQLMLGNSNQAMRLSLLGPDFQNEARKQTSLLQKIEKNTAKTAEDSGDIVYPETDLGV